MKRNLLTSTAGPTVHFVKVNGGRDSLTDEAADECYRQSDVEKKLGVCGRTLERMRTKGGGPPFVMVGRIPVYPADLFRKWLLARAVTSTSAAQFQFKK